MSLILAGALALSLTACSKTEEPAPAASEPAQSSVPAASQEQAAEFAYSAGDINWELAGGYHVFAFIYENEIIKYLS